MTQAEKSRLFHTFLFPGFFIFLLWIIKFCEVIFETNLSTFGVFPREIKGLIGVLTAPLIHADFLHLVSNSIPLLVLGAGLFYFYRAVAYKTFFWIYILTGIWVWFSARPAYHIGASGIVYGIAAFLFFSGIIRRNNYLMAFSLFVVFMYGSMFWGVFPVIENISWESHLLGGIAGTLCAIYFRKSGPQRVEYIWEEEDDEKDDFPNDDINTELPESNEEEGAKPQQQINYIYLDKKDK